MEIYGMTGERLGTIGSSGAESLPEWRRKLSSKPSISQRRGIARGFDPPYEDTDTLVLTSTHGRFIDIRFNIGEFPTAGDAYWAFSGTSNTTFPSDPQALKRLKPGSPGKNAVEIPCMAHCVWEHEIDSRRMGAADKDEGDLYLLENGECIEIGMSQNPMTGEMEMYKEYWTALEVTPGTICVVAATVQQRRQEKGTGMVVRIGNYCQAIFQSKSISAEKENRIGEVHVERWHKTATEEGRWEKDWRSSTGGDYPEDEDLIIPSKWVCRGRHAVGESIDLLGRRWEIVEAENC
jgi:hypothetical protein